MTTTPTTTQGEPPSRPDLMGEMRLRLPLPVVVPLAAVAVIAILAFGFSRVLLTVPPEAATVVAIATAANILIGGAFVALRPRLHRVGVLEIALIALYPVLIGVVIANTSIGEEAEPAEAGAAAPSEAAAPASGDAVALVAEAIQFDADSISLPAREDAVVTLDNQDTAPHNFSLYPDEQAGASQSDALFEGEIVDPGQSVDYEFKAPAPGEYYFQCDVHPAMNGSASVE
jgi:plastocyanin